jgi:hypothetical protein
MRENGGFAQKRPFSFYNLCQSKQNALLREEHHLGHCVFFLLAKRSIVGDWLTKLHA